MFGYRGEDRPLDLHDDFGPDKRDIFVIDLPGRALSAGPVLPRQPQQRRARPLPHARPGAGPLLSERILPLLLCADRPDRRDRLFPGDRRRRAGGHLADAGRPLAVLQRARDGGAARGGAGGDRARRSGTGAACRSASTIAPRDPAGRSDAARGLRRLRPPSPDPARGRGGGAGAARPLVRRDRDRAEDRARHGQDPPQEYLCQARHRQPGGTVLPVPGILVAARGRNCAMEATT